MEWIFGAFLVASMMHQGEEYFYPGGFTDFIKRLNPKFAPVVTTPVVVVINGLQLLLCVAAIVVGENALVFSMSIAGLIFINGLVHVAGCVRARGYVPGVITGILLYIPLSVYAYHFFVSSGQLMPSAAIVTGLLGLLYQAIPMGYFLLTTTLRQT